VVEAVGLARLQDAELDAELRKGNSGVSKRQSEPGGFFSLFSAVDHRASRTFTTNQPSPAGARPEPESSSRASGMPRA
jgi:hypothetical protein